jgi:hypothetical protein
VAAPFVTAGVEADRRQPRPDVVGPPPVPRGEGAQIGVLHDVGRVGRVRGQPDGQGVQQVGVPQRRLQEILMIACRACHLVQLTILLNLGTRRRPR